MRQRRPRTVEQLEACIRQEWDNIPIPKLEQLVSSVPRRLQTVYKKKRGCHTLVNMALSQLSWDVLMPWNLKSTYFFLKMIHFLSLNIGYVHLCFILNKILKFETSHIIAFCFYSQFVQCPNFFGIGFVYTQQVWVSSTFSFKGILFRSARTHWINQSDKETCYKRLLFEINTCSSELSIQ